MKKQRRIVGAILAIDLGNARTAFARTLPKAEFVFYDLQLQTQDLYDLTKIVCAPIAFRLPVMDYAVKKNRWIQLSVVPLEARLLKPQKYFIQDVISGEFSIYLDDAITPASRKECIGLECAAVWDPEHVEDRLRDHFAGTPNVWTEQLRIK